MKKKLAVFAAVGLAFAMAFALAPANVAAAGSEATTTLAVDGMTCGGCVASVKLQLRRTEGVSAYDVSLEKGEAMVTYDADVTTPEKIAESVSKTGFEASVKPEKAPGGETK